MRDFIVFVYVFKYFTVDIIDINVCLVQKLNIKDFKMIDITNSVNENISLFFADQVIKTVYFLINTSYFLKILNLKRF